MGAGYHSLHHSLYKDNYGQFFILFGACHIACTRVTSNISLRLVINVAFCRSHASFGT